MRAIVTEPQAELLKWARGKLGLGGDWPLDSRAYGVLRPRVEKRPILSAVIVINDRFGKHCRMHIASDGSRRWASRDVMMRLFSMLQVVQGIEVVTATTTADNRAAQVALIKAGFQFCGKIPCGADDGSDGILFSMLREENPWLKEAVDGQGRT